MQVSKIKTTMQVGLVLAMGVMVTPLSLHAGSYPDRSIELVIPFGQGGGTDNVGRAFAMFAEKYLGQKIVPSNRTGGSGAIGFRYGADAKPDGYTLTMVVTTLTTAPHTIEGYNASYKDFDVICRISESPMALSVPADGEIQTLEDLVARAKERPLIIGTSGPGANTHLAAVAFAGEIGAKLRYQHYKGTGAVLTAVYGGHIEAGSTAAPTALPWNEDGRLKTLVVFGGKRFVRMPDVPTGEELGYPVRIGSFRALGVPVGTPEDVKSKLMETCRQVGNDPAFISFIDKFGDDVDVIVGEEAATWLKQQDARYRQAAEDARRAGLID